MDNSETSEKLALVEKLLQERFGLAQFRPGQREVIAALFAHRGALAVFPTGGGKSLCYQLPALALDGVTLVVSPLIALMKDQIDFLRRCNIEAARLDSSLSPDEAQAVSRDMRAGTLKLVYVAPERFNNERFLGDLRQTRIALMAIDEAHCISEWGHNFRPDYLKLAEIARALRVERVLTLTATATPSVVTDICAAFGIARECAVVTGFYRANLQLRTTPVTAAERDAVLLERLRSRPPGPTIVYVTLQKTAERIAEAIVAAGSPARAYHAGMEADKRSEVQEWWKGGDLRTIEAPPGDRATEKRSPSNIVVATIAFGMGIDKADVRYVYHYNLPKSLESYSQEIGRAGRDGATSIVELLACPADVASLENFAYGDTPTPRAVRDLVDEILGAGASCDGGLAATAALRSTGDRTFDVALTDLSNRHDIRLLVVRTALTYLELLGVLAQGTPFYAAYEARLLIPLSSVVGKFEGERASFIERLFAAARKGHTWYTVRPEEVAASLGETRERVQRALQYLEQQGWIELRAAEVRQRYTRLRPDEEEDAAALATELGQRFQRREDQEISRLQQVLALVTAAGCQTHALVRHFGEERPGGCGHCTFCETGAARTLPSEESPPPIDEALARAPWSKLRSAHAQLFATPRVQARFLCGLSSPALTKAKLGRHPLFGALERHRFIDVLAWCQRAC